MAAMIWFISTTAMNAYDEIAPRTSLSRPTIDAVPSILAARIVIWPKTGGAWPRVYATSGAIFSLPACGPSDG